MDSDKKKAASAYFNQIAAPSQYFADDWITLKAKINEHKIVSSLLDSEGNNQCQRALDVGCGVGGYFNILLEKGFRIVGCDIAENMIRVCRSKYGERYGVELVMADVEHLPFTPKSFHLILCIDTLQYVSEKSRRLAVQQLVKQVKPGKAIIIEVKNKYCPAFWLKRDTLAEFYSIKSVTSVLKNSGCHIEAIKGVFWLAFFSPIVVIKARKIK